MLTTSINYYEDEAETVKNLKSKYQFSSNSSVFRKSISILDMILHIEDPQARLELIEFERNRLIRKIKNK